MMPAFSAAIFSIVSPRNSAWSIDTGVMTVASGASITLVASSRPPRPTSSSSTSAGCCANSRKPAAVVISNTVIGSPALARSHSSSAADSSSSVTSLPSPICAEAEALVEMHQMRRGVDVHAQAGGFQNRAQERDGRAFAVGAGDMDDRRQLALGMIRAPRAAAACDRATDRCAWDAARAGASRMESTWLTSRVRREPAVARRASARRAPAAWSAGGTARRASRATCGDARPCRPCRAR